MARLLRKRASFFATNAFCSIRMRFKFSEHDEYDHRFGENKMVNVESKINFHETRREARVKVKSLMLKRVASRMNLNRDDLNEALQQSGAQQSTLPILPSWDWSARSREAAFDLQSWFDQLPFNLSTPQLSDPRASLLLCIHRDWLSYHGRLLQAPRQEESIEGGRSCEVTASLSEQQ